jgi:hypothetical protein
MVAGHNAGTLGIVYPLVTLNARIRPEGKERATRPDVALHADDSIFDALEVVATNASIFHNLVVRAGFEPAQEGPKSSVLPLDDLTEMVSGAGIEPAVRERGGVTDRYSTVGESPTRVDAEGDNDSRP